MQQRFTIHTDMLCVCGGGALQVGLAADASKVL
jgi:hypothetical protein